MLIFMVSSIVSLSVPAFAFNNNTEDNSKESLVYSPENPNAYILSRVIPQSEIQSITFGTHGVEVSLNSSAKNTPVTDHSLTITNPELVDSLSNGRSEIEEICEATVFVEEVYRISQNDGERSINVLSSRLLSKEEVDAIGEDNFIELGEAYAQITTAPQASSTLQNAKGKLTISCIKSTQSYSGYATAFNFWGTASWSGYNLTDRLSPSAYEDFICYSWGGSFDYYNPSASARLSDNGGSWPVYTASAQPNAGYGWSVLEKPTYADNMYVSAINASITLRKARLTGGGNTTSVVYQYLHTYSSLAGSLSFNGTSLPSFTLSGGKDFWSLICTFSGISY